MPDSDARSIAAAEEEVGKPLGKLANSALGLVGKLTDTTGEGPKVVTEEDLVGMLLRMKGQPFDSDRLALGKVIVASSTLTAEQIGRLAATIDYSASQVEFLKYAFSYCADPQNYYKAIDVLTFNSDKRKVMDYIATQ